MINSTIQEKLKDLGYEDHTGAQLFFCALHITRSNGDDFVSTVKQWLDPEDISLLSNTFLFYEQGWYIKPEFLIEKNNKIIAKDLIKELKVKLGTYGSKINPTTFNIWPLDKELMPVLDEIINREDFNKEKVIKTIVQYYDTAEFKSKLLKFLQTGFDSSYVNHEDKESKLL